MSTPYATNILVAQEAKVANGFTATTNPSATKVDAIIAEVESQINARISRKYKLPITTTDALNIMRAISLALCVERVREIMEVKTGLAANPLDQKAAKDSADHARKDLADIINGQISLSIFGEILATSGDGVRSFAKDTGATPRFTKSRQQW